MSDKITFNLNEEEFFAKCVKDQNIPKNDALKQVLLKRIMQDFHENRIYPEQEVTEMIKKYFTDFCLIRRELINFGYMQRDPLKCEYWVIKKELTRPDYLKITRLKKHAEELGVLKEEA